MTPVTKYRCDKCGQVYPDQESAENCEKEDGVPIRILPYDGKKGRKLIYFDDDHRHVSYPTFVYIEMDNGRRATYTLYRSC